MAIKDYHKIPMLGWSVMLPEFETKGLVKFKTSNPCCYEHKTNPSPLQC
jgi:hypothetical protein